MVNDGKIYIIVTNKLPNNSGTPDTSAKANKEASDEKEDLFGHWAKNQILSTIKSTATSAVNYSLSNIGNFTGDYLAQAQVNIARNNLNSLMSIGMSAVAGFKFAGPPGAVIMGSMALISQSVSGIFAIHSARVANSKTNYEIAQLRDKTGMNTLLDGSRGTEN